MAVREARSQEQHNPASPGENSFEAVMSHGSYSMGALYEQMDKRRGAIIDYNQTKKKSSKQNFTILVFFLNFSTLNEQRT